MFVLFGLRVRVKNSFFWVVGVSVLTVKIKWLILVEIRDYTYSYSYLTSILVRRPTEWSDDFAQIKNLA